jgi:hypothetical protein
MTITIPPPPDGKINIPSGYKVVERFPLVKKQTNGINMLVALHALAQEAQALYPAATHILGSKIISHNQVFSVASGKPFKLVKK